MSYKERGRAIPQCQIKWAVWHDLQNATDATRKIYSNSLNCCIAIYKVQLNTWMLFYNPETLIVKLVKNNNRKTKDICKQVAVLRKKQIVLQRIGIRYI